MRNLIQFATTFGIALTESDTEQLGFDVEKSEFMEYFNIKDSHTAPKGFDPMDNIDYMTLDEEKEIKDKLNIKKAKIKGVAKKVDEAKDDEKMKKAEAKAKAKPKAEKAEKPKKEAKPKAEKAKKEPKVKKPGIIASIQSILTDTKKPLNQNEIFSLLKEIFPEKGDTMKKTIYCQLSGKKQPLRMEKEKGVKIEITEEKDIVNEKEIVTNFYRIVG